MRWRARSSANTGSGGISLSAHQLGRYCHDGGATLGPAWERYGRRPFDPIEVGQVYTMEIGAKVPGYGVVSLEEDLVVTADGCEFISTPQRELRLVRARRIGRRGDGRTPGRGGAMPIYEYRCGDCGRKVSLFFRSFSAVTDDAACPHCGGANLRRLMSRVAVRRGASGAAAPSDEFGGDEFGGMLGRAG